MPLKEQKLCFQKDVGKFFFFMDFYMNSKIRISLFVCQMLYGCCEYELSIQSSRSHLETKVTWC